MDLIERMNNEAELYANQAAHALNWAVATRVAASRRIQLLREAATALAAAEQRAHYATGVAELAMKHRDEAEERVRVLMEALSGLVDVADAVGWSANIGTMDGAIHCALRALAITPGEPT